MSTQPKNQQELEARKAKTQAVSIREQQQKVSDLLDKFQGSIDKALPRHITSDRMIRVALTAMTKQPDLLFCTQHSLISAVMTAGQLGLMPDSVLGECYLIPFNNTRKGVKECQIIIGYRGLCALAMRSGMVSSVQARAVYAANAVTEDGEEGDIFDYELGLDEKLRHVPKGVKNGKYITHFYAIVRFTNGGRVFNVMTREEVEKIRNESKNYQFARDKEATIWGKYFDAMGCKTVLRALMKFVPLSPEINMAIGLDESAERGNQKLSVEIMNDPATPEDMREAIEAEIVQEDQEDKAEVETQIKTKTVDKVAEAKANLEQLIQQKSANMEGS